MQFRDINRWVYIISAFILVVINLSACGRPSTGSVLRIGTTTSVQDSGLLEFLLPEFEKHYWAKVEVIAVGTGQALTLGQRGDVDIIIVHAPSLEAEFVIDGYGTARHALMFNDFIIAGPIDDPAGIRGSRTGAEALTEISDSEAPFVSRGDRSGTHIREMELWQGTGIVPEEHIDWYYSLGQGMGLSLNYANEQRAYILTDRGTYLSQSEFLPNLEILIGGKNSKENTDASLLNYYSIIPINPETHTNINASLAISLVEWLTSISIQERIANFRLEEFGYSLFIPNSEAWHQAQGTSENERIGEIETTPLASGLPVSERSSDQEVWKFAEIVWRTIQVSGTALLLACVIGIPLGVVLSLTNFRGKRLVQLVIYTGMGLPPVVVGLVVYLALSSSGPLGWLEWLFTMAGMILAQTILALPIASGLTASAVEAVSGDLIVQVRSLGATPWQERWTILLQARRGVIAAALAALGRIVSEVGAVMLVGGNIAGSTRVLSTAILLETRQGAFGLAFALGLVLLGIALLSNAFALRFGGRWPN